MNRRIVVWLGISLLWIGVLAIIYVMIAYGRWSVVDFKTYYDAATALRDGGSPYLVSPNAPYRYPPIVAQLLMPLTAFSFPVAAFIWCALNLLATVGTIRLLSRFTPPRERWALWLIPPLFWAFLEAAVVGQVTIILMALIALAWAARKTERPRLAGALLALAAWIKLFPALLILYFAWKRDWRVVWGAAAAGLALLLAQLLISGVGPMIEMINAVFLLSAGGEAWMLQRNSSILGFTEQLFSANPLVVPLFVNPPLAALSRIALTGALLLGLLWLTYPRRGDSPASGRFDLEYALVILTSHLIAPTFWIAGMPPLALVYFLLWRNRPRGRRGRWIAWFCLFAPLTFTVYDFFITAYTPDRPMSGLIVAFGFYTAMATWFAVAAPLAPAALPRADDVTLSGDEHPAKG